MKKLLATTALSLVSFGAIAADLPVRAAAPAPVVMAPIFTWTGFYVGLNAGWSQSRTQVDYAYPDVAIGTLPLGDQNYLFPNSAKVDNSGFTGGAQVGYNWQVSPSFVLGVEADLNWLSRSKTRTYVAEGYYEPTDGEYYSELTTRSTGNWLGTARLRAGFLLTPTLMFYATGGLAVGRVGGSANAYYEYYYLHGGAPTVQQQNGYDEYEVSFSGGASKTRWGWAAGLGAEWMFSPNWSAKLEWIHYDLGSERFEIVGDFPSMVGGRNFDGRVEFTGDIVRVGVNYRFGGAAAAPVVARY